MDSEHLLGAPYEHGIDGLDWTAASIVRNTVSCHLRLAGVSGHTWLVHPLHHIWANVVYRRSALGKNSVVFHRRVHLSTVHTHQLYSPIGLDLKLAKQALEAS